jgi:membrane protein implicated in regulation of membrane protease activity
VHHLLLLFLLFGWVLFLFLSWLIALPLYLGGVIVTLAIYWKIVKAQRKAPAMGKGAMVGHRATVVELKGNDVEVEYEGEIWHGVSARPLQVGQQVIIQSVEGLVLRVAPLEPAQGAARSGIDAQ